MSSREWDVARRFCGEEDGRSARCPICAPLVTRLAAELPYAHHVHSTLVCRISGQIMNEHNPPLVLPNGYVYSTKVRTTFDNKALLSVTGVMLVGLMRALLVSCVRRRCVRRLWRRWRNATVAW